MISARAFVILLAAAGGISPSSSYSLRRSSRPLRGGGGGPPPRARAASPRATSTQLSMSSSSSSSSALIVQNKGGGHGELGYQLARRLLSSNYSDKISSITILQDSAYNPSKEPFVSYASDLPNVKVVMADLSGSSDDERSIMRAEDVMSLLGNDMSYEYVWDNASKGDTGAGKAIVDCAKAWKSRMLVYVSSAGIYKPDGVFPIPETAPVKETAGQVLYEKYAVESGVPFVSFRPQYIYGRKSNKWDYIDWYFDRIVRGAPLPIPGDGSQKVSLSNSEDVASLLACVLDDEEAAIEQTYFNCGTDRLVTYDDVARMCAGAAGIENPRVVHYDASSLGKGKFPFRPTDFYVSPNMAMSKLGWEGSKYALEEDLGWYYEGYLARGGATREMKFEEDEALLVVA